MKTVDKWFHKKERNRTHIGNFHIGGGGISKKLKLHCYALL